MDSDIAILELHPCFQNQDEIWPQISSARKISHDLVVSVKDIIEENHWIITDIRGPSVRKLIQEEGISQTLGRNLLSQFLELLDFFQEKNFVHGDIRPETLLLPERQSSVALTDHLYLKLFFSLGATLNNVVPMTGRNTKYVAPEMINPDFGVISPSTDMYCLAFTVLELLAGPNFDRVFERINMSLESTWIYWHGNISEDLPTVREVFPKIASDLESALTAMLKKHQNERPASAGKCSRCSICP